MEIGAHGTELESVDYVNNMNVYLDIETCANLDLLEIFTSNIKAPKTYKDEDKIKEYVENAKKDAIPKMMVDIDYCNIACIGCKKENEEAKLITLEEFAEIFNMSESRIIVFNGKKFDLPILLRQSIKKSLDLPYRDLHEALKSRYSPKVIDVMEELGNYGDYKSMDTYLKIYCGIEKTPIDFVHCSEEELETHCLEDVTNLEILFNKFNKLF